MRWEYFSMKVGTSFWLGEINDGRLISEMNALGAEGWELVATLGTTIGEGRSNEIVLLFKRPV